VERKSSSSKIGTERREPDIVKKRELAFRCSVTPRTITDWQAAGLPFIKVSPRLNLYDWPSVKAWLLKRQVQVVTREAA
jgi:phage terminase Nu1 subunit (DNA packaging protein)